MKNDTDLTLMAKLFKIYGDKDYDEYVARVTEKSDAHPVDHLEKYWCGCIRYIQWKRCMLHVKFTPDKEPETERQSLTPFCVCGKLKASLHEYHKYWCKGKPNE